MRYLTLLLIVGTLSWGCSSSNPSDPGNTASKDFLVKTVGSYMVYNTYFFQPNSTTPSVTDTMFTGRDSIVVAGTTTIEGKSAVLMVTYLPDGTSYDTSYFSESNGKVYEYADLSMDEDATPQPAWLLIADDKATAEWTVLEKDMGDIPAADIGLTFPGTVNVSIKITAKKVGTANVTVAGKSYSASRFQMKVVSSIKYLGVLAATIEMERNAYLAKEIGLLIDDMGMGSLIVAGTPQVMFPGNLKILSSFKVN